MTTSITQTQAWKNLLQHYDENRSLQMSHLFAADSARFENFSIQVDDVFVDYSKNCITHETLSLLVALAREAEVEKWRDRMLSGDLVNLSENQAADHVLLRGLDKTKSLQDTVSYAHLFKFAEEVRTGQRVGHNGKRFRHIVCLGIGGSKLGNKMTCHALEKFSDCGIKLYFMSAADARIKSLLDEIDLSETLFIMISKSFMTPETVMNASYIKDRLIQYYASQDSWKEHFVGVSSNQLGMEDFGLLPGSNFLIPQSVGGRYSIWSAAGLPLLIMIGMKNFSDFLQGARMMDSHFAEQPLASNLPVLLGLIGLWYASFYQANSRAVLTYGAELEYLAVYLQQLEMESNGKSVDRDGLPCDYLTAPVVWGGSGPDGQHAFFQWLHQGTSFIPVDFVAVQNSSVPVPEFDNFLYANLLAQSSLLMSGREDDVAYLRQVGNQPSNVIILKTISPYNLGSLIALYEHRTFVQAMVWRINPFDQWGVELGKQIAQRLLSSLSKPDIDKDMDASTLGLIKRRFSSD